MKQVAYSLSGLIFVVALILVGVYIGLVSAPIKTVEIYPKMEYAEDSPPKKEEPKEEDEPWLIIRCSHRVVRDLTVMTVPDEPPPVGADYIYKGKWWKVTKHYYGEMGFRWIKIEKEETSK